ncbi:hypothetical protein AB0D08_00290 [Kitasatospora sp. NPDC048540]|uniref:hypothetical protein n=1 Tax=Kitasatospora sp. NPDC048540 TaxID=3155634 RepID=UPI0033F554E0
MSAGYNRALVEHLLPAVWDQGAAYGLKNETRPDADMPKGFVDKKKGSPLMAHLSDIRQAWKTAPLTVLERQSLLLRYGLDWTFEEIGKARGVRKQSAQESTERGVGKMAAQLNGVPYVDGYDNPEDIETE